MVMAMNRPAEQLLVVAPPFDQRVQTAVVLRRWSTDGSANVQCGTRRAAPVRGRLPVGHHVAHGHPFFKRFLHTGSGLYESVEQNAFSGVIFWYPIDIQHGRKYRSNVKRNVARTLRVTREKGDHHHHNF